MAGHGVKQGGEPLPTARGGGHHRQAQPTRQQRKVGDDALFARLVHQINADHDARRDFGRLQNQVEVSLQTARVAHHDHGVGVGQAQEIPRHLFLRRMRQKGVGAGKVHKAVLPAMVCITALSQGDRFARPVAGVLVEPGQGVEDGGLSHVGIAGQRHREGVFVGGVVPAAGLDQNAPGIFFAQGNGGAADEIGRRVPARAAAAAFHQRPGDKADVLKPPPHGPLCRQAPHQPLLPTVQAAERHGFLMVVHICKPSFLRLWEGGTAPSTSIIAKPCQKVCRPL